MPTASYPFQSGGEDGGSGSAERIENAPARHADFDQIPHKLQRFLRDVDAVLRIGITEYARQAAHRAAHRHGAVGAPHHIFALLAETPFLRAAGHLIPYHAAPPDPSGPLQSVSDGGVLPPIDEQADRRTRLAGFTGIVQPLSHPAGPASLIPIVPSKSGGAFLGSMLLYFCVVVRFFSAGFQPPEA